MKSSVFKSLTCRLLLTLSALYFWVLLTPVPAVGQTIQGRLLDLATDRPIPATMVTIVSSAERPVRSVLTDSDGIFVAHLALPGRYHLRAEAFGYSMALSGPLDVRKDEVVEIELRLAADPVALTPLVVVSDRPALVFDARLERRGYYERQAMSGHLGAHFLGQADLRERHPHSVEGALRSVHGLRVRHKGGRNVAILDRSGRIMTLCLDGAQIGALSGGLSIDALVPMTSVVAIEIYPSRATSGRTRCTIMVWTGIPPDQPKSR